MRRVWSRPFAGGDVPTGAPLVPVRSPPRPSAKANDETSISPLCLSSVLLPAIPGSLRNMSTDGPPACVGVEKVSVDGEVVSPVEVPAGPGSPCGPGGPAGPVWLQLSGVSPAAQACAASSMIRTAPGGVLAGLMQAWMVASAAGMAANATAAPAPRAASVGSAKRRRRRVVGLIGRP